jgi:predicted transcriptional regulator
MAIPPNRPDLFIVARLLDRLWREGAPVMKTRLSVAANMNYDQLGRYLSWLSMRDLVAIENPLSGHARVTITDKGKVAYLKLIEWLKQFVDIQSKPK